MPLRGAEGLTYATADVLKYPIYLFCHDSVQALLYDFPKFSALLQDQQSLLSGKGLQG